MINRRKAFTLAEVLITLGIIGVVAALTIPTLINSYQEKANVSKFLKTYSALNQAFLMATTEYGPVEDWGLTNTNTGEFDENGDSIIDYSINQLFIERLKKFMKADIYKDLIGNLKSIDGRMYVENWTANEKRSLKLSDGVIIHSGYLWKD